MNILYEALNKKHISATLELFKGLRNEGAEVSFTDIMDEKEMLASLGHYLYIARMKEEVIGIFRGIRGLQDQSHSILITIATHPEHRGNKIAHNLIHYSLQDIKAKEEDIFLARAYVFSDNKPSINTLLSCGFTISGSVYKHHFSRKNNMYIDDIILHKVI